MIYHLIMSTTASSAQQAEDEIYEFEVEYKPIAGKAQKENIKVKVADMLKAQKEITKGDAIVEYAEFLKKVKYPLDTETNRKANITEFEKATGKITQWNESLQDKDISDILILLKKYEKTLKFGEQFTGCEDKDKNTPEAALGLSPNNVLEVKKQGRAQEKAIVVLSRLNQSIRLVPQEGYKFLAISSGPVGNPSPSSNSAMSDSTDSDPLPEYNGYGKTSNTSQVVYDLHQVSLKLKAPHNAKSFSFDFNFFSAEYPNYVNKSYNDTFYATIEAASTNNSKRTNITFDPEHNPIEVDNNYFQKPFHPIPNTGTGFDAHGSTGWLRTNWPIQGGETFTITFSIHDEGDGVYDSLVILDNFQWHNYEAVGTTDPLN
jgi:hypothetical protein